jgi:omega-6 fatty acid desaturase (delta-12 desaturase)
MTSGRGTEQPPPAAPSAAELNESDHVLQRFTQPNVRDSVVQLLNTVIPFGVLWFLMLRSLTVSYWLTLVLAIPAAGLLVRMFIIQHDCGHGSFLPRQSVNNAIGFVIGILTLTPYGYWRRIHSIHHATSGDLDRRNYGDITTLTVQEYLTLSRWRRVQYRLYRHPIVLFGLGPAFLFLLKHRCPYDLPLSWTREWRSVALTNLAIAAVAGLMAWAIGWRAFLLVQLPITLLAGTMGIWLFYVQHQFDDTYWNRHDEWDYREASVRGSSYYALPAVINWFTGNIGVHHIHHLNSRIPNYRLHDCLRANPRLQNVTRLTLRDSIRCIKLKLWDEDSGRLVGFRDPSVLRQPGGHLAAAFPAKTIDCGGRSPDSECSSGHSDCQTSG